MLLQILETIKYLDPEIKALSDDMGELGKNSETASGGTLQLSKAYGDVGLLATLTKGISGISAFIGGEDTNGLGLMSGIQGGFAGLQGLFGGEAGSDSSQLLVGLGRVGELRA
jgi:hypothetical protein